MHRDASRVQGKSKKKKGKRQTHQVFYIDPIIIITMKMWYNKSQDQGQLVVMIYVKTGTYIGEGGQRIVSLSMNALGRSTNALR